MNRGKRKVEDSTQNREKCGCSYCPNYPHDCSGEILYCATGKSSCEINAKGCICNTCPIYEEYELDEFYYCDKEKVGQSKTSMRKKSPSEDNEFYQNLVRIKDISATGESITTSMGSLKKMPFSLNDIHFIPAQVGKIPLNREEEVKTEVIIGKTTKKPMKISSPIMISGMSFGAVSKNVKLIIAKAAAELNIAYNSGEGGILTEEFELAPNQMIVQYSTGRFGINEEILKSAPAVEIRFGQGAYPGKGSYLPARKLTAEIAQIRGLKEGEPAYSPSHHFDMEDTEQIREKIAELRKITGGAPIGAKIGCGNVERDIRILADSKLDFIALDGFGGSTGATDFYVRENLGIPITAALPRAIKELNEYGSRDDVSLIAGGKLLDSADFAKCLALGADAVYIGTTALIAINCQQYRICYTGKCPTGIATQNPDLMKQLDIDKGVKKLKNFINVSTQEIANLARIVGKNNINELNKDDLVSMDRDLSMITGVKWVNGENLNY